MSDFFSDSLGFGPGIERFPVFVPPAVGGADALLLEIGDNILLETGDNALVEDGT